MEDFKTRGLELAEVVDAWRVVPRLALFVLFFMILDSYFWIKGIPDPTSTQQWLVNILWGTVGVTFKFYVDSGRKWSP